MDSVWSNLDIASDNLNREDPIEWNFDINPDQFVLSQHLEVIKSYFGCDEKALKPVKLIQTPHKLFDKHIIPKPTSYWKAIALAVSRDRFDHPTTCFENPGIFYQYPNLRLIISKVPVKCHKVIMRKSGRLRACFQGFRWAVFEMVGSGNSYHFETKRWSNVPEERN